MKSFVGTAKSSIIYNGFFNIFRDVIQFALMLILVRKIAPIYYGYFALLTSIMSFVHVFSFATVVQKMLQRSDEEEIPISIYYSLGFWLQTIIYLVVILITTVHYLIFHSDFILYLPLLGLSLFLEIPAEILRNEMQVKFEWLKMRRIHAHGLLIMFLVALALIYFDLSLLALIVPQLFVNIPFLLYALRNRHIQWRRVNYSDVKDIIRFGLFRSVSGLSRNAKPLLENSIISIRFSVSSLGVYNRALGLVNILTRKLVEMVIFAIYPVLTNSEVGASSFKSISSKLLIWTVLLLLPVMQFLVLAQNDIVNLLYGPLWLEVSNYIPVLSVLVMLNCLLYILSYLSLANDRLELATQIDMYSLICGLLPFLLINELQLIQVLSLICLTLLVLLMWFLYKLVKEDLILEGTSLKIALICGYNFGFYGLYRFCDCFFFKENSLGLYIYYMIVYMIINIFLFRKQWVGMLKVLRLVRLKRQIDD